MSVSDKNSEDVQRYWDARYEQQDRIWSGRVNAQLAAVASQLPPGRALDIGCGEGGDALWLAERRWQVVAVDVSETALRRARREAESQGLADRIEFEHHDLPRGFPEGTFDLASAQYLHSLVRLDRPTILRRAAAALAPGGTLLIVDHAAAPPWSKDVPHDHPFPSAEEVLAQLDLPAAQWERVRVEVIDRTVADPHGNPATIQDNVMMLRRRP